MMETGLTPLIFLSAALFCLGFLGVVIRRNVLVVLMCIELMLNAVNLAFITFSRLQGDDTAQVFVLMIFVVAAVEVAVAAAIIVNIFKIRQSISVDKFDLLRG